MDRRELLKMVAALTGGIVIGGEVFLSGGCNSNDAVTAGSFSKSDIEFLDEVAETILPKTNTPGAKEAAVGTFMTVMVNDCYTDEDQKIFHEGIKKLNEASNKKFNKEFMSITPEQKHDLLAELDKSIKAYQKKTDDYFDSLSIDQKSEIALQKNLNNKDPRAEKLRENPDHYFTMMKQLTLLGYFTSEPGATKALRYIAIPGRYEGSIPYTKGEKAWAT